MEDRIIICNMRYRHTVTLSNGTNEVVSSHNKRHDLDAVHGTKEVIVKVTAKKSQKNVGKGHSRTKLKSPV